MQCITNVINPADACLLTLGSLPPMPILRLHLAGTLQYMVLNKHTLLRIIIVLISSIRNNIIYIDTLNVKGRCYCLPPLRLPGSAP